MLRRTRCEPGRPVPSLRVAVVLVGKGEARRGHPHRHAERTEVGRLARLEGGDASPERRDVYLTNEIVNRRRTESTRLTLLPRSIPRRRHSGEEGGSQMC